MTRPGDDKRICRCGCWLGAHLHYRAGTDCVNCGEDVCEAYHPMSIINRIRRRLAERRERLRVLKEYTPQHKRTSDT